MTYSKHIIFVICFVCSACVTVQPVGPTTVAEKIPKATAIQDIVSENPTDSAAPTSIGSDASTFITFQGQVEKGQTFEKAITDTHLFRLMPLQHGWEIWIGDKVDAESNYSAVATPPFRGINARHIEGWHFRNSDNSGPNEAGEKNVNAPQQERAFCFFLNESDYQIAKAWLYEEESLSAEEQQTLEEKYTQLRPSAGLLSIRNLELDNLTIGERAWIESMEFEVELRLTKECGLP